MYAIASYRWVLANKHEKWFEKYEKLLVYACYVTNNDNIHMYIPVSLLYEH
jgi:hypothetical protein